MPLPGSSRRRALATLALILIAGLAYLLLEVLSGSPEAQSEDGQPRVEAPTSQTATAPGPDEIEQVTARQDVETNEAVQPANAFTILGRCVAVLDGAPVPNAVITMSAPIENDEDRLVVESTSDGGGRFESGAAVDGNTDLILRVQADGFTPCTRRLVRPRPGTTEHLGDIPMLHAIEVSGRVVDEEGLPVEAVGMLFAMVIREHEHSVTPKSLLRTTSDASGRFRFDQPAWPGEWYVGAEDTGALVDPRSVRLLPSMTEFDLRVVVERPDPSLTISGTVRDRLGQPVEGLRISAMGEGYIGRGRSRQDGSLSMPRAGPIRDDGKPGVQINMTDDSGRYELVAPAEKVDVNWGDDGLEVVVGLRPSIEVRVVDEQGVAVPRYTLFALRNYGFGWSRYGHVRIRGHHESGRCSVTRLRSGSNGVLVVPDDDALAPTELVSFTIGEDPTGELLITAKRRTSVRATVVTPDGRPVSNTTVELLQRLGKKAASIDGASIDIEDCDRVTRVPNELRIAHAMTDADGVAVLDARTGRFDVRVRGGAHVPHVETVEVTALDDSLRITVAPAGSVSGRVAPPEALETLRGFDGDGGDGVHIALAPTSEGPDHRIEVDEDGVFRADDVAPGEYDVYLRYWLRSGAVQKGVISALVERVTIAAGEERRIDVDANSSLPGSVRGSVLVNGQPLREVHCFLVRSDDRRRNLRVATDESGQFQATVPPGEYGFAITLPAQPGPGWIYMRLPDRGTLAPGDELTMPITTQLRRLDLRVLDTSDEPVANRRITIRAKGFHRPGALTTDEHGALRIHPAPPVPFRLQAEINGQKRISSELDPAALSGSEVVVVRLAD